MYTNLLITSFFLTHSTTKKIHTKKRRKKEEKKRERQKHWSTHNHSYTPNSLPSTNQTPVGRHSCEIGERQYIYRHVYNTKHARKSQDSDCAVKEEQLLPSLVSHPGSANFQLQTHTCTPPQKTPPQNNNTHPQKRRKKKKKTTA